MEIDLILSQPVVSPSQPTPTLPSLPSPSFAYAQVSLVKNVKDKTKKIPPASPSSMAVDPEDKDELHHLDLGGTFLSNIPGPV